MNCAICLETISDDKYTLECKHEIHNNCISDYIDNIYYKFSYISVKNGKPFYENKDDYGMYVTLYDSTIKCPICRVEYTVITDEWVKTKKINLKRILGRVWFGDIKGRLTFCHQITSRDQIKEYYNIQDKNKSFENLNELSKLYYNLFEEVIFKMNDDICIVKCSCVDNNCIGFVPMAKARYNLSYCISSNIIEFYSGITNINKNIFNKNNKCTQFIEEGRCIINNFSYALILPVNDYNSEETEEENGEETEEENGEDLTQQIENQYRIYNCSCGSRIQDIGYSKHIKSNKHILYVKKNITDEIISETGNSYICKCESNISKSSFIKHIQSKKHIHYERIRMKIIYEQETTEEDIDNLQETKEEDIDNLQETKEEDIDNLQETKEEDIDNLQETKEEDVDNLQETKEEDVFAFLY
jgi:hypothetical protein